MTSMRYILGGKLGRRLLKVRDIMHGGTELPVIGVDTVMVSSLD